MAAAQETRSHHRPCRAAPDIEGAARAVKRLYIYAIASDAAGLRERSEAPALPGLRGTVVQRLTCDGLAAWLSALEPLKPTRDDVFTHHRVVEALCALETCLPVRFGTFFATEAALRASLAGRRDALHEALARVEGKREIAVTLEWVQPELEQPAEAAPAPQAPQVPQQSPVGMPVAPQVAGPVAPAPGLSPSGSGAEGAGRGGPGTRYLEARQRAVAVAGRRRRRAERMAQDLRSTVGSLAVALQQRLCPSPRVALSCAILIDPVRSEDVLHRVREVSGGWGDVRLHVAGPWPPYSFSGIDGTPDTRAQRAGAGGA